MDASIQHAGQFLSSVDQLVARMDEWGYSLALRFGAYDRAHAQARMIPGGHFSISCGFAVARKTHRWLTFAIGITQKCEQWLVTVTAEDEDEDQGHFRWESPPISVSSLDEFSAAIDRIFALLESAIGFAQVAEALKMCSAKYA